MSATLLTNQITSGKYYYTVMYSRHYYNNNQCTVIVYITYYYNEIQCNKLYPKTIKYKWQGPDLGARS